MPKNPGVQFRWSDLFVVRIWRNDSNAGGEEGDDGDGDGATGSQWQGRVQRPVSGEAHQFRGLHALLELIEAMLAGGVPNPDRGHIAKEREAKPHVADGGSEDVNKASGSPRLYRRHRSSTGRPSCEEA